MATKKIVGVIDQYDYSQHRLVDLDGLSDAFLSLSLLSLYTIDTA